MHHVQLGDLKVVQLLVLYLSGVFSEKKHVVKALVLLSGFQKINILRAMTFEPLTVVRP